METFYVLENVDGKRYCRNNDRGYLYPTLSGVTRQYEWLKKRDSRYPNSAYNYKIVKYKLIKSGATS